MPLNPFFDTTNSIEEQELHDSLINEAIGIHGVEAYYLPRTLVNISDVFNEEQTADFNIALPIATYVGSIDGFGGAGQFLGKFGPEIRDRLTLTISIKRFEEVVAPITGQKRPSEGDIMYLPMTGGLYEILFTEPEAQMFYQLGKLHTFDMTCELFEYNNEVFNTGIAAIDNIQTLYSTNTLDSAILDTHGVQILDPNGEVILDPVSVDAILNDQIQQNTVFNTDSEGIIDFSISNPFSERIIP